MAFKCPFFDPKQETTILERNSLGGLGNTFQNHCRLAPCFVAFSRRRKRRSTRQAYPPSRPLPSPPPRSPPAPPTPSLLPPRCPHLVHHAVYLHPDGQQGRRRHVGLGVALHRGGCGLEPPQYPEEEGGEAQRVVEAW